MLALWPCCSCHRLALFPPENSAARQADEAPAPPNIILIFADDLDLDLGTVNTMPNLQALLADQGVTLPNFFVNASICCPSRASMLRGQYVHNTGVLTNGPPEGGFESFRDLGLENDTMATRLQGAGYRTVLFGKYLNRYPADSGLTYIPPGWNEWVAPAPTRPGYDQFNYTLNDNGTLVAYGSDPEDYLQDVLSAKAQNFITRTHCHRPALLCLLLDVLAARALDACAAPQHALHRHHRAAHAVLQRGRRQRQAAGHRQPAAVDRDRHPADR